MSTATRTADPAVEPSRRVLEDLLSGMPSRPFDVRFWDGSVWPGTAPAEFTLVLHHPGSVRAMFWPPNPLTFGEAYVYDDFDIEGDMYAFQHLCTYLMTHPATLPLGRRLALAWRLWWLPKQQRPRVGREAASLPGTIHSKERDRAAISYHYDLPPLLFEKILGPSMTYSCAVFASADEDLTPAQFRKIDLVCRKLRMRPGCWLLDIGLGWGTLATHVARNYGAHVLAVTISKEQAEWAGAHVRAEGLQGRVRVELADYRDIPDAEKFDHITNIEVSEHFGARQMPTYFRKCERLLRPGGTILHQQITLSGKLGMTPLARDFMGRFIFPDGELVPLHATLRAAEQSGLEVRDVESFREHYPLTLRHWLAALEANEREITEAVGPATYRVFRMYLSGAAFGFERGDYNLHQILLVKPDGGRSGMPLSRSDWYGA
jgi:cyclopropane-fatty-acyl-phospholipid synthase